MIWPEDRIETLRELAASGLSAAKIADAMTAKYGERYTKNSIIGKVHRERIVLQGTFRDGLKVVQAKRRLAERTNERASKKPRPLPVVAPPALEIVPEVTVSFEDLGPGMCRWPFGNGPYQFCGCAAAPGKSYCETHHAKAWRPPNRTAQRTKWNFARRTSTEAKVNA